LSVIYNTINIYRSINIKVGHTEEQATVYSIVVTGKESNIHDKFVTFWFSFRFLWTPKYTVNNLHNMYTVLKELYPTLGNKNRVLLQQDNTRPHTSRKTRQKLDEFDLMELLPHLSYRSDLALCFQGNRLLSVLSHLREHCEGITRTLQVLCPKTKGIIYARNRKRHQTMAENNCFCLKIFIKKTKKLI